MVIRNRYFLYLFLYSSLPIINKYRTVYSSKDGLSILFSKAVVGKYLLVNSDYKAF